MVLIGFICGYIVSDFVLNILTSIKLLKIDFHHWLSCVIGISLIVAIIMSFIPRRFNNKVFFGAGLGWLCSKFLIWIINTYIKLTMTIAYTEIGLAVLFTILAAFAFSRAHDDFLVAATAIYGAMGITISVLMFMNKIHDKQTFKTFGWIWLTSSFVGMIILYILGCWVQLIIFKRKNRYYSKDQDQEVSNIVIDYRKEEEDIRY